MPDIPRRRKLSRKGCSNCKRLKIKCNEGKPACEYCLHRGRECIYPKEAPSKMSKELVVSDTSEVLKVHSFNSTQTQLNITRFEYRLLRFFNDHCVQMFTYTKNPRAEFIWRYYLPSYFGSSPVIRQAVFAFASLNLWPITNLSAILADDENHSNAALLTPMEYNIHDLSHVFDQLSVDSDADSSILDRTNVFFDNVVRLSAAHIQEVKARGVEYADVAIIYLSTTLTFTYLGLHPHSIMPLVDFCHTPPSDLLSYSRSIHNMMRNAPPHVYEALLHKLTEFKYENNHDVDYHVIRALKAELEVHYSVNQNKTMEAINQLQDSGASVPVSDFVGFNPETFNEDSENFTTPSTSEEVHSHSTPGSIYELDSQTSREIETFRMAIAVFETCFHTAIITNYPLPLFKFLPFIAEEFSQMARAKHPFALRLLLLYSLFCIYGKFYIQRQNNLWAQYVQWYAANQKLSKFDMILYNYVILGEHETDDNDIKACFMGLSSLFEHYDADMAFEDEFAAKMFATDEIVQFE